MLINRIELKDNNIKDKIPKEIKLLKDLEYLNLHNSQINGVIPEYIGDLPKLTYLDLGDNNLKDLPDIIKQKIMDGHYAYCDVEGNKFKLNSGWYFLKGKWCYLDEHGERARGTQKSGKKTYEFDQDGNIKSGWQKDENNNR